MEVCRCGIAMIGADVGYAGAPCFVSRDVPPVTDVHGAVWPAGRTKLHGYPLPNLARQKVGRSAVGVPAVVQVGGGAGGQCCAASVQPAEHVFGEKLVPVVGTGQAPLAQFAGLKADVLLGVLRGDATPSTR